MKNRGRLIVRYIFMALSIIIMALIFFFSSQNGNESGELSETVADILEAVCQTLHMPSLSDFIVTYVRKCAHVFIYIALGLCVSICVFTFQFKQKWLWILLPFVICFVYACSDEFHQIFISGREGKFTDVLVDAIGFVTAILLANLVNFLIYRNKLKPEREEDA